MKYAVLAPLPALVFAALAHAQAKPVFRCDGNIYTNDPAEAKAKNCRPMTGGNVTIVEGTRPQGAAAAPAQAAAPAAAAGSGVRVANAPPAGAPRIDTGEQRLRDTEARTILEAELKKAEARQADLLKEFNNGEPEKQGAEGRNYQKYLDRVAELKASIARNESDIAGLRRELGRLMSQGGTATR